MSKSSKDEFKRAKEADAARLVEEEREMDRRAVKRDWKNVEEWRDYMRERAQDARIAALKVHIGNPWRAKCCLCERKPDTARGWVIFDWELLDGPLLVEVAKGQDIRRATACVCRKCYFRRIIKCNAS